MGSGLSRRSKYIPTNPIDVRPASPSPGKRATLTVVQITDVYILNNFPHLRNMLKEQRAKNPNTISMLTGDFLAPYLLSTLDQGVGMMRMLNATPVDYLTWGNHEADIAHTEVCNRVREYQGTWINTNMQSHEAMESQKPYDIVVITSPDGSHTRRVGLVAVLSDQPDLYRHFKAPGAFGGAKIECPWGTLQKYKRELEEKHGCDLVLPLCHLYVPQDHRTCREFDFPVILSGHDHHMVDETVDGTRLLKPGQDAHYATVLELSWNDPQDHGPPTVVAEFVKLADWPADAALQAEMDEAYAALDHLRKTELSVVPQRFRPLSSVGARSRVCSMGRYICSLTRDSLNSDGNMATNVDAVLLMGGNVRGAKDYPDTSYFSMEDLMCEVKEDEVVGLVDIPGWLIAAGIKATHDGPRSGYFQYDDGVHEDASFNVTMVAGRALEPDTVYRVATKIPDLTNGQSPPLKEYFLARPELLPHEDVLFNIHVVMLSHFARGAWRRIWRLGDTNGDGHVDALEEIDIDGDGSVSLGDIKKCVSKLGMQTHEGDATLTEYIFRFADSDGDGRIGSKDLDRPSMRQAEIQPFVALDPYCGA